MNVIVERSVVQWLEIRREPICFLCAFELDGFRLYGANATVDTSIRTIETLTRLRAAVGSDRLVDRYLKQ